MPAGTFGITLGIPQGADHHLSAGQAVAGVQIAQVALGMDFTGLDDLEKVRNRVRTLQSLLSFSMLHLWTLPPFSLPEKTAQIQSGNSETSKSSVREH